MNLLVSNSNPSVTGSTIFHYLLRQVVDSHGVDGVRCTNYYKLVESRDFAVLGVLKNSSNYHVVLSQWYRSYILTHAMVLLVILVTCMVDMSRGVSTEATYQLRPSGVYLNCVSISSRSSVDCALQASQMYLYKNQFAYRDGQCHICRADNANCAASDDEYLLAGPHHIRGRFFVISNQICSRLWCPSFWCDYIMGF